jgi:hypothetical protein
MVLALCALRRMFDGGSGRFLVGGPSALRVLLDAQMVLDHADSDVVPDRDDLRCRPRDARIYRARLALYLRAVLRADAGDCGMVACPVCGFVGDGSHERGADCVGNGKYALSPG